MTFAQTAAAVLLLAIPGPATADEPKRPGHVWEGLFQLRPGVKVAIILNVTEGPDGALTATWDSPDQGGQGLRVDSVKVEPDKLAFTSSDFGVKFEGVRKDGGDEAVGNWTQGGVALPLTLTRRPAATLVRKAAGKETLWEGKLPAGLGFTLRLVFHVGKERNGVEFASMDSPDQGAKGIRVDSVTSNETGLSFDLKAIGARYEGKLNAEGTEAVGTWTQGGRKFPLTLMVVDKETEVRRPQTPRPPFPYKDEAVSYANKPGGVTLAGTLTVPQGTGPFPAALLITGSGAQDRDETLFQHKPFLVIADALTRRGVAVLRVDDRGVGGTSGSVDQSTTDDFAGDVLAGIAYLKTRPEIDPGRIGLIGHSEGGLIGPLVASKSGDVAFVVMLAGTGLPGDEILGLQGRLLAKALGSDEKSLDVQGGIQKAMMTLVKTEKDPEVIRSRAREVVRDAVKDLPEAVRDEALAQVKDDARLDASLKRLTTPWFRYFLAYDPRPALAKVRCPVLALVGEKDLQVPPKENLREIERALKEAGNTRATVKELPGLNHLFQTCKTGSTAEYAEIEETFAASALDEVVNWVVGQTAAK